MGIDSVTPGRMAITYYRELTGSDFLDRVERWHESCAWIHDYRFIEGEKVKRKYVQFVGAPAPKDIAEAAYGSKIDDKLKKATVERILPCIIDGRQIPRDIVESVIRRVSNRIGLGYGGWKKALSIACALYRKIDEKEEYSMTLEKNRQTRDYLYGRLLAVAEHIENRALSVAGERRDTTAAKMMQRFSGRPFSSWKIIEEALTPYKTRLRVKRPSFLYEMKNLLDAIHDLFQSGDYESDQQLSGEYLLGYHCQRRKLYEDENGSVMKQKIVETVE
jgi:CRISPR-associated protein Csd1